MSRLLRQTAYSAMLAGLLLSAPFASAQVMSILPPSGRTGVPRGQAEIIADSILDARRGDQQGLRSLLLSQSLVTLAALPDSMRSDTTVQEILSQIQALEESERAERDAERERLVASLMAQPATSYFAMFADGTIKSAVDKKESSAATGSLGFLLHQSHSTYQVVLSILETAEARERDFGASLLPAGVGGALTSGIVDLRHGTGEALGFGFPFSRLGLHAYMSASSYRWNVDVQNTPVGNTTIDSVKTPITVLGFGAHLSWNLLKRLVDKDTPASIIFDVGIAGRVLQGDYAMNQRDLVGKATGLFRRGYWGTEYSATLQYRMLRFNVTYYYFGRSVPGFSKGQITGGAGVFAPIFEK